MYFEEENIRTCNIEREPNLCSSSSSLFFNGKREREKRRTLMRGNESEEKIRSLSFLSLFHSDTLFKVCVCVRSYFQQQLYSASLPFPASLSFLSLIFPSCFLLHFARPSVRLALPLGPVSVMHEPPTEKQPSPLSSGQRQQQMHACHAKQQIVAAAA